MRYGGAYGGGISKNSWLISSAESTPPAGGSSRVTHALSEKRRFSKKISPESEKEKYIYII